jgi:hypothetical protein
MNNLRKMVQLCARSLKQVSASKQSWNFCNLLTQDDAIINLGMVAKTNIMMPDRNQTLAIQPVAFMAEL